MSFWNFNEVEKNTTSLKVFNEVEKNTTSLKVPSTLSKIIDEVEKKDYLHWLSNNFIDDLQWSY